MELCVFWYDIGIIRDCSSLLKDLNLLSSSLPCFAQAIIRTWNFADIGTDGVHSSTVIKCGGLRYRCCIVLCGERGVAMYSAVLYE